ncbi:NEDD8-activating enzyme E1 catalytic subunit-like [Centruroides sculpturatus]|uniref:NEDD8-activating enzyme E1 catalytic subunit-like n=1 Tax=Centruroides sculpturatus TaxID=218467 RepID=UPI000C6D8E2C|nr:NEDD8-activating enzyme E1 catalytic subunit-like [Centruroides sculpturatus]
MGFRNIDVIDMDTIEISNLNRQFLFRPQDVGKSKAEVAAEFINKRIPNCRVTPYPWHFLLSTYALDEDVWIHMDNACLIHHIWKHSLLKYLEMLEIYKVSLLKYDNNGELDPDSIIPMVDGGTEGFKGNGRVIIPGMTACLECNLDLFPPQVNFPLCTIAHTPRLPEHCIEYVRVLLWSKEYPFGDNVEIDGDDPEHIQWIYEKASERANEYNIQGVTYRLTQGNIFYQYYFQNDSNKAMLNGFEDEILEYEHHCTSYGLYKVCSSGIFMTCYQSLPKPRKLFLLTKGAPINRCCPSLNNYVVFNDADGLYTYTFEASRKEDCLVCSQMPKLLTFKENSKLQEVIEFLSENPVLQMKSPGITTAINGKRKTLYIQSVESLEKQTRPNLKKSLKELGLIDGQEILVADVTSPNSLLFKLHLVDEMQAD